MSRELLFEIGVEEVPSAPLYEAIAQLKRDAEEALREARLEYGEVRAFGAPRHLVLRVSDLAERQEDRTLRVKGPAAKAAFDADGNPTQAALGFARGKGVDVSALVRESDDGGGEYVYAVVEQVGEPAEDVLPKLLADLAGGLDWPKSQRWGDGETRFIRPVRWLLALFGEDVLEVGFAGLTAGRETYGHRFLAPGPFEVASPEDYDAVAASGLFVYDHEERAQLVREGVDSLEAQLGVHAVVPGKTFAEVVNLVEWPTVAVGRFDEEFLAVPREVIESAMTKHQRYFPVEGADGALASAFIVVHNGDPARTEPIVAGHERVIRARLADATFFYREDLKVPIDSWAASLDAIVFQEKLGSLGEKARRMARLARELAGIHGADEAVSGDAAEAARLAKADLASHVVVEFPELQGVMGGYYARAAGKGEDVAGAIVEHYRPRFAGDDPPSTGAGRLVSAADKLDTIAGIFAIGQAPTGSADPYALRRSAIGVLTMILGGLRLTLGRAVEAALEGYPDDLVGLPDWRLTVRDGIVAFVNTRLAVMLRDKGFAYDTVDAVMERASDDPADTLRRVKALDAFRASDAGADLAIAFKRAMNLSELELGPVVAPALLSQAEERDLFAALNDAEAEVTQRMAEHDYEGALARLAGLRGPVDAFFDAVLVMAEEADLRENRLKLLNRLVGLFSDFADFGTLAG